ncbi:hypothetical protein [Laribacter hongkongensis]|uniref:hypothetical protein n=1 Tax=Laribacter hongkongensis TaxID=168471 RepID=UPI0004848873|nr:hypothetical protein [Laribacter hongkongensis]
MEQKSRKYRYTKQLINMALRDGWTQKQIADACRTQQSVVSAWKNGAKQAFEHQLKPLLEVYGARLRRKSFRIYHDLRAVPEQEPEIKLIKVEGEVIFSHAYDAYLSCPRCNPGECKDDRHPKKSVPQRRIIIHDQGAGKFCLVKQERVFKPNYQTLYADANIFTSHAIAQLLVGQLLALVDDNEFYESQKEYKPDKLMIRTLLRKALLEHGIPLEGVEEHLSV